MSREETAMQDEDSEIRARLERDRAYWIDASILHDLEKGKACDYGQRMAAKMLRSRGDWIVHAESEIARLRKELDEARREICFLRASSTNATEIEEPEEVDASDLEAMIAAARTQGRDSIRISARDLWRMASDKRVREEE